MKLSTGVPDKSLLFDRWNDGFADGLEGPMQAGFFPDDFSLWRCGWRYARIWGTHFNPGFEVGDLRGGELFVFGGHSQVVISITNCFDQETMFDVAGTDCGPSVATF